MRSKRTLTMTSAFALLLLTPAFGEPYFVTSFTEPCSHPPTDCGHQWQCFLDQHHFLTIRDSFINGGTFEIRAHPGVDPDGWGTTVYGQAFLLGATLGHATTQVVTATKTGVTVLASGGISRGEADTFGTWNAALTFAYAPTEKRVIGSGTYSIDLPTPLSSDTLDLTLVKAASNLLTNVPLLSGGFGNTGDMSGADATPSWHWQPQCGGDFPQDFTQTLMVDVQGQLNQIDTLTQGRGFGINPAYKPGVRVTLDLVNSSEYLLVGIVYTCSFPGEPYPTSQDFAADNIGVTPYICYKPLPDCRYAQSTHFDFDVGFTSDALPGDGPDSVLCGLFVLGDSSGDRVIDNLDINPFVQSLVEPDSYIEHYGRKAYLCRNDMNSDGSVDGSDIRRFIERLLGSAVPCSP